jgi:ABC-type bacteriocin/lantibiotic exporter with double-glycine peptidase domain
MTLNELKRGLQLKLLLISLAVMLLSLALPIAMLQIYDRILPNQGYGTAWVLALGVLSAMMLEAGLRYGRSWLLNRAGMKFEAWSNVEVMQRLLTAPVSDLKALGQERIEEGFTALRRLQEYYSGQAMLALYDAPFIVIFLAMIAYVGGMVVLIPLTILILAFITVYLLGEKARGYAGKVEQASDRRSSMLAQMFEKVLPLKGLAMEGHMIARFDRQHRELATERAGQDEYMMRIQLVTAFFSQATTVLVVMFSAHLVIEGEMSSGALAACTLLAGRTMAPVGALFSFWGRHQSSENAQEKAEALLLLGEGKLRESVELRDELIGLRCKQIRLPNVNAALSLDIAPGAVVRLEETGWTRWTPFFHFLLGSEQDSGIASCEITNEGIRRDDIRVALVEDDARVFQGTVLENLTTFTSAREQLALEWSQKLGLHERIIDLPQGYHTQLAEHHGSGIDRGTQQLLGIARAIVSQPDLLLFNHADRGLDISAQKRFAEALMELQGGMTCMVTSNSVEVINAISEVQPVEGGQS